MSIAENIKKIRLEHGLSQAELGKIAGVSDKAVSTWELGTKIPRMGAVEKMANYFGIPKVQLWMMRPLLRPPALFRRASSLCRRWTVCRW
ncbi:MAG: helix-turn-helix transcriptional regulator [Faecalibacterium sp.]